MATKRWVWFAPVIRRQEPNENHELMFNALLAAGIAVAGIDIGESYGAPWGRDLYTGFYRAMRARGYSARPCLLVQSRGALMGINWAIDHPAQVGCIAAIYPVLDLRSWPAASDRSHQQALLSAYQTDRLSAILPIGSPLDRLALFPRVPWYLLYGDHDTTVPAALNAERVPMGEHKIIQGHGHEEIPAFLDSPALIRFLLANSPQD